MASTVPAKSNKSLHSFAQPPLKLNNQSGMHVAMHHKPLHGGRGGGGVGEHEASRKGKLKKKCKSHAKNCLEIHDGVVEKLEEKGKVAGLDYVGNVNDIDNMGSDRKSRSKLLIKIPSLTRKIGNNVVDKEGEQVIVNEQGGEDDEPVAKNWSLRPKRSVKKALNVDDGGGGGGGVGLEGGGGSGLDHVANNVNDIDYMSIDEESRSNILIKIPSLTRNIGKNIVDNEEDQVMVNEQKGEDDVPLAKIWNLKSRRQVKKSSKVDFGGGGEGVGLKFGGGGIVHEKKDQLFQENLENGDNIVDEEEYQVTLAEKKGDESLKGGEDDEPMAKIWNLRPRRQVHKSSNVDDWGGVGLNGGGGSANEKKDQLQQVNLENGDNIVDEEEYQVTLAEKKGYESLKGGEDDEPMAKIWNLRPRRQVHKSSNVDDWGGVGLNGGGGGGSGSAIVKKEFSLSLTSQEIDEDIYSLTGSRASRRPRKRPKAVQKLLDNLFPGQSLAFITPDSYKVSHMKV